MPSSSRIIFAEDLGQVRPFDLGALPTVTRRRADTAAGAGTNFGERFSTPAQMAGRSPSVSDPRRQAFEQGFQRGAAEAHRVVAQRQATEAAALGASLAARIDALAEGFESELAALEQHTAERVVDLALEIARRVIGDSLATRSDAIVHIVRDALAALAESQASPVLRLNPDDLEVVQEQLAPVLSRRRIDVVADPSIRAGGCLLQSAGASVDATLQARWTRTLAAIGHEEVPL